MCVALESPEGSLDVFYTFLSRGGARVHRLGEVSGHSQRRPGLTRGRDPLASECERGVFGASGLSVATTRRSRGFYPTIPVIDRCFFRGKSQPRARSVESPRAELRGSSTGASSFEPRVRATSASIVHGRLAEATVTSQPAVERAREPHTAPCRPSRRRTSPRVR